MSNDPFPGDPADQDAAASLPGPKPRHPLGLPPGSVRALLILMVAGTIWTLLAMPAEKGIEVPLYLYYLLFLTLGAYFSGRSKADRSGPAPLYLPRGSIRLLLVLGCVGVIGYDLYLDPSGFLNRPLLDERDRQPTLLLPVSILGAYLFGVLLSGTLYKLLAGPTGMPAWYQDVVASLSVVAVLGLGGSVLYELVIAPGTATQLPEMTQLILSGIVAFYFGARA